MNQQAVSSGPRIDICECLCRDGLQHEKQIIDTDTKVTLLNRLGRLGFRTIEATSFAHPKYVPQFGDAEEVLAAVQRPEGVSYRTTCVNLKGVERALAAIQAGAGPDLLTLVLSASEPHSLLAQKRRHDELKEEYAVAITLASREGAAVQGTLAGAWGGPLGDPVSMETVTEFVSFFVDLGCERISLGDTTGLATPPTIKNTFRLLREKFPSIRFVAHLHDTRGTALANAFAAIDVGVTALDSAIGGTGGHPAQIDYGAGHTGNLCTEDLVVALERSGLETGLDVEGIVALGRDLEDLLGRRLESRSVRLLSDSATGPS